MTVLLSSCISGRGRAAKFSPPAWQHRVATSESGGEHGGDLRRPCGYEPGGRRFESCSGFERLVALNDVMIQTCGEQR
jgi:hypothetical protein